MVDFYLRGRTGGSGVAGAATDAAGLTSWKPSVVVATTGPGALATAYAAGQSVDGVVLVAGWRILIKNQAAGAENGIYVVQASGAPVRAADANTGPELVSASVPVDRGTANAEKTFTCTNDAPIVLGTTAIVFVAFSVAGALLAANNLSDVASAATARTNLGLVTLAATGLAADIGDATAVGRSMLTAASAAAQRTLLSLAALATSGVSADITDATSFGRAVLTAVSVAAQRTALGLAAIAASGSASDLGAGTVPAARMPAFTGDFTTVAGGVASTLSANAVVTASIADAAVTLAKLANEAQATVIGRASGAGTGVPVALSAAQLSTILGLGSAALVASTTFDAAGLAAAAQAASQPLDSDLTAIAALTTTAYGRAFLALANQAALVALMPSGSASWGGPVINAAGGFYEDWAPTGYADCLVINITGAASFNLIRGLQGGVDGRILLLRNGGTTALSIAIEAGTSAAANRFAEQFTGAAAGGYYPVFNPGQSALFRYSGSASRWIPLLLPGLIPAGPVGECQFAYFGNGSFSHGAGLYGATGINAFTYADNDSLAMGGITTVGRIQERKGADVASANEMTLAGYVSGGGAANNTQSGNLYKITGTTTIKGIDTTGWQAGSRVRLTFASTITIQDGFLPTAPKKTIYLKSGCDREMQAGEFLTLVYDGTSWNEA